MISDYTILGNSDEPIKISFGRGTIKQAFDDHTIGGVNFGYDNEHNFGAIFIEGKLYSSRVLDIVLSDNSDNSKNVKVLYVDNNGYVQEKTFETTDKQLVDDLISAAIATSEAATAQMVDDKIAQVEIPEYKPGDYIGIVPEDGDTGNFLVSIKYNQLFQQIKEDLHIEDEEQDERILNIEHGYTVGVTSAGVSLDERTESFRATMKSRNTKDEEFVDTSTNFKVPTDMFYENLDRTVADIYEQLSQKSDWKDVHELLNESENEGE